MKFEYIDSGTRRSSLSRSSPSARIFSGHYRALTREMQQEMEQAAEELRALVSALARELAIAQPRIALMGGLLAEENVYREAVCAALSGMAQPVRPLHDALWGAAQLAFEALGE